MKRKILLLGFLLCVTLVILTGCSNKENNTQNEEIIENIAQESQTSDLYKWIIEPTIEADDIIDLDMRQEVSLIRNGKKYNFINNDQGKELLRQDFFGYAALDNGEIYIWQEGGTPYKVNDDYSIEEAEYAGDFAHNIVYYNTVRKEFFIQHYMYMPVTNSEQEVLENYKTLHDTMLECFVEVTPTDYTDDGFDRYAEFSENDLGKYGYYNKETLEIEIAPIYDKAFNFYEGYAAVKKDGKAGFINLENKEEFLFEFEETRSLDKGRAWVKANGKWGVIKIVK